MDGAYRGLPVDLLDVLWRRAWMLSCGCRMVCISVLPGTMRGRGQNLSFELAQAT